MRISCNKIKSLAAVLTVILDGWKNTGQGVCVSSRNISFYKNSDALSDIGAGYFLQKRSKAENYWGISKEIHQKKSIMLYFFKNNL